MFVGPLFLRTLGGENHLEILGSANRPQGCARLGGFEEMRNWFPVTIEQDTADAVVSSIFSGLWRSLNGSKAVLLILGAPRFTSVPGLMVELGG